MPSEEDGKMHPCTAFDHMDVCTYPYCPSAGHAHVVTASAAAPPITAQTDIHTETATVREALLFSARLRLPAHVSDAHISE